MDPWHLTQVLIANSELSGQIWAVLEQAEVLSPFFISMVREHQDDASIREVLMSELRLRSDEKEIEQRLLVNALQEDTTYVGKLDLLLGVLSTDTLGTGRAVAYQLALTHGRTTEAAQLANHLGSDPRYATVLSLGSMYAGLGYDWTQAGTAQLEALRMKSDSGTVLGRGAAWGIRFALGATDSLPNGKLPFGYRSAVANHESTVALTNRPMVGAYPNPAQDRLLITYPADEAGGTLELLDALGRTVFTQRLNGANPFMEIDVRSWTEGLYLARVLNAGTVVGETKCAIAR